MSSLLMKPQVPAFTVPQLPDAMEVIQEKAHKLMIPLEIAEPLDPKKLERLKLSLSGDHQLINSGLAISLCKCWLQRTGNWEKLFQKETQETDLPDAFYRGLSTAHISGRAQIVYDSPSASYNSSNLAANPYGDLIFYLDGAHSPESMEVCARWFSSAVKENHKSASLSPKTLLDNGYPSRHEKENSKILLFNCMDVRDPQILFPRLVNTCASSGTNFSKALFVPSMSTYSKVTSGASTVPLDTSEKDLSWQFYLQRLWEKIIHGRDIDTVFDKGGKIDSAPILPPHRFLYEDSPHSNPPDKNFCCSAVMPSLPLTIKWLRDCVKENPSIRVHILVTGSLHLVGDMLKLLRR